MTLASHVVGVLAVIAAMVGLVRLVVICLREDA